jgi:IS30 family transposase
MSLVLASLPATSRLTLTGDQGSEMAYHDRLAEYFVDGIYFARSGARASAARGASGRTRPNSSTPNSSSSAL